MVETVRGVTKGMNERLENSLGLVREIEALGRQWRDWRQGERRQSQAAEILCGVQDPSRAPAIVVSRDEFSVAGAIMVCLHPDCGGFVRIQIHLEDTPARGDKLQRGDPGLVRTQDLFRQTDGFRQVASGRAVFHSDLHAVSFPPVAMRRSLQRHTILLTRSITAWPPPPRS